jgi:hypothetical protein
MDVGKVPGQAGTMRMRAARARAAIKRMLFLNIRYSFVRDSYDL